MSGASGSSVAARIAARLNPEIQAAVNPATRFTAKFQTFSYTDLCKFVAAPLGFLYAVNSAAYLTGNDSSTLFGWRILAHAGPYHIPKLVESGKWRSSLELLGKSEELGLIESEIAQLLTDAEVVTQRRVAVRRIIRSEEGGFKVFLPLLDNLASKPLEGTIRKGQSHFEANLRAVMDVVTATPAKDRRVPIQLIERLVSENRDSWESDANEESKRFREYRAVLLLKLLQNSDNLAEAKLSQRVKTFVQSEWAHSVHQPFSTLPLMPLLYQFKTQKLGYEYSDIIQRLHTVLDLPLGVDEKSVVRQSLSLPLKLDFTNFEKLVYLTICYGSLRVVPMISEYSFKVLTVAGSVVARSVIGASLLELTYRAEEHIIQSAPWYDSVGGVAGSAVMTGVNILVGACVLKYFPFCGMPWLMMKFRDSFSDGYRFL